MINFIDDETTEVQPESTQQDAQRTYAEQSIIQQHFIDYLCHEMHNPLNGVLGSILALADSFELLKLTTFEGQTPQEKSKELFKEITENLEIAKQCASQQKVIMDNVLILSKLKSNKIELNPSHFELTETIINFIKPFTIQATQKNLLLSLELPESPIWIASDLNLLSQIITNLLSNAIKFTEYGGITFTVNIQPTFSTVSEISVINFIVKDTGIGMLPHQTTNLLKGFVPYNRTLTKYTGSGLGLIITKQIIELMGGTIQIESELGKGSKFFFWIKCNYLNDQQILDAVQIKPLVIDDKGSISIPILIGKRILIVEDNEINTKILLGHLKKTNCCCKSVSDGLAALELYEQYSFDLILMDIQIPNIDGIAVTKKIREKELLSDYKTPIIGVSSYTRPDKIEETLQSGMNFYLSKPYTPKELFEVILKCISITAKYSSDTNIPQEQSNENLCTTPKFSSISAQQSSSSTPQSSNTEISKLGDSSEKLMIFGLLNNERKKKSLHTSVLSTNLVSSTNINSPTSSKTKHEAKIKCVIL